MSMPSCAQLQNIQLLVLDVDGIMTDSMLYYGAEGELIKAFNVNDGSSIKQLKARGVKVAVISAKGSLPLRHRLEVLGIEDAYLDSDDKLRDLRLLWTKTGVDPKNTCYMGDDRLDIPCLRQVGLAIVPWDAVAPVKRTAHYVSQRRGGEGLVAEFYDLLMAEEEATAEGLAGGDLDFHIVIPARYASSRFPGKPLALVKGKPMIAAVVEQALKAGATSVIAATDNQEIAHVAEAAGARVVLTASELPSGSDRVFAAVAELGLAPYDIVVNLQGDEPGVDPEHLRLVAGALSTEKSCEMATLASPLRDKAVWQDPGVVKVVTDCENRALMFSRAPLGLNHEEQASVPEMVWHHHGIYAYRVQALRTLAHTPPQPLEQAESLEQLRALGLGIGIHVSFVQEVCGFGIDTPQDLERFNSSE